MEADELRALEAEYQSLFCETARLKALEKQN